MNEEQKIKKNRITMLVLVAVFLLPIVLAKIALESDFFNKSATNRGELLEPAIELGEILKQDKPVWRLVYALPETCDQVCENALYSMNQVWHAIGRDRDRVEASIIYTATSDVERLKELKDLENFSQMEVEDDFLKELFKNQTLDGIFVADTLGNVILKYPLQQEQQQAVLKSRDILADMKKLLKLSRIG